MRVIIRCLYPCENCLACGIDINSPEPYICHIDGHHGGSATSLGFPNCPLGYKVKFKTEILDD